MDGVGQWKLIEPQEDDRDRQPAAESKESPSRGNLVLVVATVALVVAAAGVAIWATLPSGAASVEAPAGISAADAFVPRIGSDGDNGAPATALAVSPAAAPVVVDVQGAVANPGVHELPSGSRVADAVAAAGGYAHDVDIAAASAHLNLAEKLVDGAQIRVPTLGDEPQQVTPNATSESPPSGASGLIDINSATAEELDTLPGVGPVTAAKIIDARSQAPFASVDELLARDVVGAATFEKISALVTAAP